MSRRGDFDALSAAQVVAGRIAGRWVDGAAEFRPAAPARMAELLDTIDHVAEAATGERSFLHRAAPRLGDKPETVPKAARG